MLLWIDPAGAQRSQSPMSADCGAVIRTNMSQRI